MQPRSDLRPLFRLTTFHVTNMGECWVRARDCADADSGREADSEVWEEVCELCRVLREELAERVEGVEEDEDEWPERLRFCRPDRRLGTESMEEARFEDDRGGDFACAMERWEGVLASCSSSSSSSSRGASVAPTLASASSSSGSRFSLHASSSSRSVGSSALLAMYWSQSFSVSARLSGLRCESAASRVSKQKTQ